MQCFSEIVTTNKPTPGFLPVGWPQPAVKPTVSESWQEECRIPHGHVHLRSSNLVFDY